MTFIISFINNSLNKKDINLEKDFIEIEKEFENLPYYDELKSLLKENYSIIGKNFLGLILNYYFCEKCKKKFEIIKEFNVIDLNYIPITNQLRKIGNSFADVGTDEYLEYFFLKKHLGDHCLECGGEAELVNENSSSYLLCKNCKEKSFINSYKYCEKCKKFAKIYKKEILRFPPFLIIRLNRGKFEEKKGFINDNDNDNELPIDYSKIEYITSYYYNKNSELNLQYELISHIDYEKTEESVKFKSICKSPFDSNSKKEKWISFDINSQPKNEISSKKSKKEGVRKDKSIPCILFYQIKK